MQLLKDTFITLSPLYVYMLIGVLLRKTKLMDEAFAYQCNSLVYHLFVPLSVFCSTYTCDLSNLTSIKAAIYAVICIVILFVLCMIFTPKFVKELPKAASLNQCIFRSNFVLIGLVYVELLYGSAGMAQTSLAIAIVVPVLNVLAVSNFEILGHHNTNIKSIVLSIIKNPIIIGTLLGLLLKLAHIELPSILYTPIKTLGSFASPFAMVVVGALLTLKGFKEDIRLVTVGTIIRLVLIPVILLPIAALLGFRDVMLISLLTCLGGPTAVAGVSMSAKLGGDAKLSGELLASTTIFSTFTMYFFIVLFRALGLC